jgi:hypothetical protein
MCFSNSESRIKQSHEAKDLGAWQNRGILEQDDAARTRAIEI